MKKDNQKEKLKQLISMIAVEMRVDQAIVLANNAENEVKGLKAAEAKLGEIHKLTLEEKKRVLEQILERGQETLALANLPFPNPKDRMFVAQQLTKIASEAFGLLARFASADSDATVKRLAPFYEAYQALAQHSQIQAERDQLLLEKREAEEAQAQLVKDGKTEDAKKKKEEADKKSVEAGKKAAEAEEKMAAVAKAFTTLREEGYKTFGDGDAAVGKKKLEDIIAKAQQFLKDKKIPEAQKLLAQIPQGLLDAHEFLAQYEGDKLKEANLLALDIWDHQQKAYWSKSVDNETDFWNVAYGFALGRAVRAAHDRARRHAGLLPHGRRAGRCPGRESGPRHSGPCRA